MSQSWTLPPRHRARDHCKRSGRTGRIGGIVKYARLACKGIRFDISAAFVIAGNSRELVATDSRHACALYPGGIVNWMRMKRHEYHPDSAREYARECGKCARGKWSVGRQPSSEWRPSFVTIFRISVSREREGEREREIERGRGEREQIL